MKTKLNISDFLKTKWSSKYLNLFFKTFAVCFLVFIIYNQVFAREDIAAIWSTFLSRFSGPNLLWLLGATLLMPLNWMFETLKFRELTKTFEALSFWKSYKAIFAGITFSIFTPNRVGEYAGRVLLVRPENNWKAVIATLVGSFSQLLILLSMGLLGLVCFAQMYLEIEPLMLQGITFLGLALIGLMLFCFFNIGLIIPLAKKLPYAYKFKRLVKDVRVLENYSRDSLTTTLGFAFCRYVVYCLQYFLFLQFFGIEVNFLTGLSGIATIFFLQTSIPIPPIMGLLVRSQVALFVWGFFSTNEIGILASTFSLWVLNLIIPAMIGILFIVKVNWLKSLGYEK